VIEVLVDRYALEAPLATGGMGTVHRATDRRLGRTVAIKVLKENLSGDPRFVERFRREARAAAGLAHPNVASIFDYGEEGGRHFIVMEYIEGRDLSHMLREEGKLEPNRAAAIAHQAAAALGHAHSAGLVHRDVKASNVMLTDKDHVKVTDFGIARAAGDSTLTATGTIMGTAHYLSPEQASGGSTGPPSDVYSLGIVLYEMLTGALPFSGDSPLGVAMRHVQEVVPRPSELTPNVPPPLDDIAARATAKAPEDRFADGNEMAAALGSLGGAAGMVAAAAPTPTAVLEGEEVPPTGSRWSTLSLMRMGVAILVGLALLALGLALFRTTQGEGETPRQQREAAGAPAEEQEPSPSPEPEEPPGFSIPSEIRGQDFKEWEDILKAQDFEVEKKDVEDSPYPKDTIHDTDPPPGSELEPGQPVTLFVSKGEGDDDNGDGKGKGKDKGKGKGKGNDD
jgi:hypothetical protein